MASPPLAGRSFVVDGEGPAAEEAAGLLIGLGGSLDDVATATVVRTGEPDPLMAWAHSGAMWLTGAKGGPPLAPAAPVAARLIGAAGVLEAVSGLLGRPVVVDGPRLLAERAAIAGLGPRGRTSAGGGCRLLSTLDGWVAVNLPRADDIDLLAAWLALDEAPPVADAWATVERALAAMMTEEVVDRAALLGLAVAALPEPAAAASDEQARARGQSFPFAPVVLDGVPLSSAGATSRPTGGAGRPTSTGFTPPARLTVLDLSSLWAGPLCAHLLGLAGAAVVKVESIHRPDGARSGPAAFYDLLHAGHRSVALDLATTAGVDQLRRLIERADVVVEASRPRAMRQMGIDPAAVLARPRPLCWVSITGYGRSGPWADRPAFGDDAAVAAGLVAMASDGPVFYADAVADPVSGLYAAIGALAALLDGAPHHVDVAMREAAGHLLAGLPRRPVADTPAVRDEVGDWVVRDATTGSPTPICPPRARPVPGPAAPLGVDTAAVLDRPPAPSGNRQTR